MKSNQTDPNLEALLQSEPQRAVQRLVQELPEESLSLAWRSELNEKLRQTVPQPRWRGRLAHGWRPALGLALAGCLAFTVMLRSPDTQPPAQHNIEASLVQAYTDTSSVDDLAGAGLSAREIGDTTRSSDSSVDWTEADLGTL